jgi:hypothetical protein
MKYELNKFGSKAINMKIFTIKNILLVFVITVVVMQFFQIDKTNPDLDPAQDFVTLTRPPADVEKLIKGTCYDCHSHETQYPWYTNVSPINWWIKDHINEGREHLNFSIWGTYSNKKAAHKLEECYEEVEEGEMPLSSYSLAHADARFSEEEKTLLVNWFKEQESAFR